MIKYYEYIIDMTYLSYVFGGHPVMTGQGITSVWTVSNQRICGGDALCDSVCFW